MATSGYVQLPDAKLYYETYGSGHPILLLHGNGQAIDAFNYQIPQLAKHFLVIVVDTRGHGKSTDDTATPLSYGLFADDMKQLLDELQIPNTHILGWSDGGITGLIMAIKYPQYVSKLATMGANIFPGGDALLPAFFNHAQTSAHRLMLKTDAASKQQLRLLTLMLTEPQLTFNDLKAIKCPVLIMAGEDDIILESHTRAVADAIPNSTLIIFKEAGHSAPVEIPERFNEAVIDYLNR